MGAGARRTPPARAGRAGRDRPPRLNLATTPTHLTPGALQRHLQRHPEDRPFEPLLRSVFEALEQAPILGSLLKPGEHLDQAIRAFRKQSAGGQCGLLDRARRPEPPAGGTGQTRPRSAEAAAAGADRRSFAAEASDTDDVGAALFGREAGEGVRLLQLLDRSMRWWRRIRRIWVAESHDPVLKQYLGSNYEAGKDDLFSAFIVRSIELCCCGGQVAMITHDNWMFLQSYAKLRALPSTASQKVSDEAKFTGLLREDIHRASGAFGCRCI